MYPWAPPVYTLLYYTAATFVIFSVHKYDYNADTQYINGARLFSLQAQFGHVGLYWRKTRWLLYDKRCIK